MEASQPHAGTRLCAALDQVRQDLGAGACDRIIVITDEQSQEDVAAPETRGYMINVASARNGVGYGAWQHIDGWSEAAVDYIRALEAT